MQVLILHPGATVQPDGTWLLNRSVDRELVPIATADADLARWAAGMVQSDVYRCEIDEEGRLTSIRSIPDEATSQSPAPVLGDFPVVDDRSIRPLLEEARAWMEGTLWPAFLRNLKENATPPGQPASLGMCSIATPALVEILTAELPDGEWRANGGHPTVAYRKIAAREFRKAFYDLDGGMWDYRRQAWDGHYWVEGKLDGRDVIVDLTADQYGWDPVIVTTADDMRYRASYRGSVVKRDTSRPTASRTIRETLPTFLERNVAGMVL